jgi:SET domain-containing protein
MYRLGSDCQIYRRSASPEKPYARAYYAIPSHTSHPESTEQSEGAKNKPPLAFRDDDTSTASWMKVIVD